MDNNNMACSWSTNDRIQILGRFELHIRHEGQEQNSIIEVELK